MIVAKYSKNVPSPTRITNEIDFITAEQYRGLDEINFNVGVLYASSPEVTLSYNIGTKKNIWIKKKLRTLISAVSQCRVRKTCFHIS